MFLVVESTSGQVSSHSLEPSVITSAALSARTLDATALGQHHVAYVNGTRVILDPAALSSVVTVVPSAQPAPIISTSVAANAAATAAAIALTNLQNKVELLPPQPAPLMQQTVIMQAPPNPAVTSCIAENVNLSRVVFCSAPAGKPLALTTPVVTLPKNNARIETIHSSAPAVTSTISFAPPHTSSLNINSRAFDLLTSAALVAAAANGESVSTSTATTTYAPTERPELASLPVTTSDRTYFSRNESIVSTSSSSDHQLPSTSGDDKSTVTKFDIIVTSSGGTSMPLVDTSGIISKRSLETEEEAAAKRLKTQQS